MCIFELADIIFFVKSLKTPTSNFNVVIYVKFSRGTTRSYSGFKLIHNFHQTLKSGASISTDSHHYGTHSQLLILIYLLTLLKARLNSINGNIS